MPTQKQNIARAKSTLAQWLDEAEGRRKRVRTPSAHRRAILAAFDRLPAELEQRDGKRDLAVSLLPATAGLRLLHSSPQLAVGWCPRGLVVGAETPCWSAGWRAIMPGDEEYDLLSWFMHYVRQYIERSLLLRVVAGIRRTRLSHVFSVARSCERSVDAAAPRITLSAAVKELAAKYAAGPAAHVRAHNVAVAAPAWSANFLDPDLHRAGFALLRGDELSADDYGAEAVVQYDTTLTVLERALRCDRTEALRTLGLGRSRSVGLRAAFLRNHFGAHSGGWRWWDFDEMFGDDVPRVAGLASKALDAACAREPAHRRVEPSPARWSSWFWENFSLLWKAVWFAALSTHPR